jgi:hypothetical protein
VDCEQLGEAFALVIGRKRNAGISSQQVQTKTICSVESEFKATELVLVYVFGGGGGGGGGL